MEWWQRLGYDTEGEAIRDGATPPIDTRTDIEKEDELIRSRIQPGLQDETFNSGVGGMTLDEETEFIRKKVEGYTPPEQDLIVTGGGNVTKYIIVQGPGGRYVKQEDAAGTYTDATVQAEIDRLNKQRDERLLEERLNAAQQSIAVYTPQTVDVPYEPVESPSLTTKEEAKLRFPYLDERLIDIYVQGYIDTGSSELALLQMRSDPMMETVYPGIRKEDNSLRMTEQEYIVAKEFMQLELRNYNLNPQVFDEDIVEAISGDVSPAEFAERLQTGYQNIVQNIPQVKEVYLREFNLDLNEESIFGMFISPKLSTSVLDNQIRQSQIIAEAETALGTSALTTQVARGLQQQGLTQAQARRGFQTASTVLPGLSRGAESFGRGAVTATGYVEATELGQQSEAQRIGRIQAQIASASSAQAGAATLRTGEVVGLEEV